MIVEFDKSFDKSLNKIRDKIVLKRIKKAILDCESSDSIKNIHNLKKLVGFKEFYRIKIGDYRLGLKISGNTILVITVRHRKDIYRKFP